MKIVSHTEVREQTKREREREKNIPKMTTHMWAVWSTSDGDESQYSIQ